jgi:hypothetical protein
MNNSGDFGAQVDKFINVLQEKDKMVEDKNKVIFMLQQRVGELETRLQHMVALPEYNKEKQTVMLEKERLETKISELSKGYKLYKTRNTVLISMVIIALILIALGVLLW